MNVFRVVLFLAGLAVYLLAKQFLPSTDGSEPSRGAAVLPTATTIEWVPVTPAAPRHSNAVRLDAMTVTPVVVGLKKSAGQ